MDGEPVITDHKVSVIVPCYNQSLFLWDSVQSIIDQTHNNWECIIVNDGSTDNSEETALELIKRDARIKYFKKENGGLSSARNYGIEQSSGNFILPLDADDKIHSTYLEKGIKYFADQKVKVVYCEAEYFGERQGKLDLPEFSRSNIAEWNMIFCTALFRRSDFDAAGGYNLNMNFGWEDWNLWIAILKKGGDVIKIPEVLFYYRIKEQSMLTSLQGSRKQKMFMQLYLNHQDFFDKYYDEPTDIFDNHRSLKNYCKALEADNTFLKGILKLKPASYIALARRIKKSLLS
jgi:glycosyltransferase involved in cell wall biosynthesis